VTFLVDANVLSEPTKPRPNLVVVNWLRAHNSDLAVNPIILGELELGILLLPAGRRRARLLDWFDQGAARMRALDIDRETAGAWANLVASLRRKGRRTIPVADSLIAATAIQHGLVVATRNVAHYRNCGVEVVNPFDE